MKIALTGGIACGKSQISRVFKNLGADIINLDDISREVVAPSTKGLLALVSHFGNKILKTDNSLDRGKLREILLDNQANKQIIEDILHPKILEKMKMAIENSKKSIVIVEIPLLLEKNWSYLFDRAIIVHCNDEKQLKRLIKRENFDKNTAKQLISTQTTHKNRLKLADQLPIDVIENNSEIFDLEQQTTDLYQKLINL